MFCIRAPINIEQPVELLGLYLALFLGTASNTPNFTVTSTKEINLHILAPISTWFFLQKLQNFVVLDVVYIRLLEIANIRAILTEIWENLWSVKHANPTGHNTAHSKCNFMKFFEPLWVARFSANELWVHVNHVRSQRSGKTKMLVLQDSLKLLSFIKITQHPQISCFGTFRLISQICTITLYWNFLEQFG